MYRSNPCFRFGCLVLLTAACSSPMVAQAGEWDSVPVILHKDYQAVTTTGASAYSGAFPVILRGVVLNDTEDWLDPTAAYDPEYHFFNLGGQAECYVQTVANGDFGGTACWMGQNYGNHPKHQDPMYNYTDAEWYAELDRLGIYYEGTSLTEDQLVRAGDLVEVRARTGLNYGGKMNVNEGHSNDSDYDFEILLLQKNYGLPAATEISLDLLKAEDDTFLFDDEEPTREFGGELYQSTWVELQNVRFTDDTIAHWGCDADLTVTDETGRTLTVHLGLNDSFETSSAPTGFFNAVGILDQSDTSGIGGYQLLVMNASAVPEPATLTLTSLLGLGLLRKRR